MRGRRAVLVVGALAAAFAGCETRPRTHTQGSGETSTAPGFGENRVLEIDLTSGAPEAISGGLFRLPATRTYTGLVRALERSLDETTSAGVFVRMGGQNVDLAQAQELGSVLATFAKKKVPVVCHADGLSNATAALFLRGCTRRWLSPAGEAETVGIAAQVVYLKGILDRLKIQVDFLHVGKFKSGPEPLTHDGPSPEARESLETTLASLRDGWLALAPAGKTRDALEHGPYSPEEAKANGLVDALGFELEALADAKKLAKAEATQAVFGPKSGTPSGSDFTEIVRIIAGGDDGVGDRPHIAVVPMQGGISTEAGGPFESGGISSRAMVKTIRRLAKDAAVKAVVVRIDSPGGSPLASDLIWHELMELRKAKPVVASVGSMAASGGYYIACAAQRIFAEPSSIVGSIGVFGGKVVFGPALGELGVNSVTFPASRAEGAAERAAYLSPLIAWDEPTRERVRALMQSIYDLFIQRVALGRKMAEDKVRVSAEGRIWSGPQGLERGLVDEIGGLQQALAAARKLAGLSPNTPATVEGAAEGLLDLLSLDAEADEARVAQAIARLEARRLLALDALPAELRPFAASLGPLLAGETVVAALPFALTVR
ncbi:MAG TPA: signal peptide peptidase SppA [Polyangiaceae bacterium]